MRLVIIDYGAGNTRSVQFAFERLGCELQLSSDPEEIRAADGVIFPGVGNAGSASDELQRRGLSSLIGELKVPVLGICLGMQLLCESSEEEDSAGLGVFEVPVLKFNNRVKTPQIGWNQLEDVKGELFKGVEKDAYVYFVHSYYVPLNDYVISSSVYGQQFSAAIQKDNFYACQFHPEKSGKTGEQILKNFIGICESYQR